MALAKEHGLALIVDETYRDFHSQSGAPHDLFAAEDWADNLVHLYSFSKVFRLTGHRVGALVASTKRMAEVEKFLDSVVSIFMLHCFLGGEALRLFSARCSMAIKKQVSPSCRWMKISILVICWQNPS